MRCLYLPPAAKSTLRRSASLEMFQSITIVVVDSDWRVCYKLRKPLRFRCAISSWNGLFRSTKLASEPFGICP